MSRTIWQVSGKVIFNGKAHIGHGSRLSVKGDLEIGDNFIITAESQIVCFKSITFGDNVLVSWDTLIMDTDLHTWIGCRSTILKGVILPENTIVAAESLITRKYTEPNLYWEVNYPI